MYYDISYSWVTDKIYKGSIGLQSRIQASGIFARGRGIVKGGKGPEYKQSPFWEMNDGSGI